MPGPIARGAFFLREKLFDAVVIQRGHVVRLRENDSLTATPREDNAPLLRYENFHARVCASEGIRPRGARSATIGYNMFVKKSYLTATFRSMPKLFFSTVLYLFKVLIRKRSGSWVVQADFED